MLKRPHFELDTNTQKNVNQEKKHHICVSQCEQLSPAGVLGTVEYQPPALMQVPGMQHVDTPMLGQGATFPLPKKRKFKRDERHAQPRGDAFVSFGGPITPSRLDGCATFPGP